MGCLWVKYEDLKRDAIGELLGVMRYVELPIDEKIAEVAVSKFSFESQSGRIPGQENRAAFLRKGIVGDWQNYFDEECIEAFKTARDGQWNRLLVEMGYESDLDWS